MCGIFGVYGNDEAAKLTYFGLFALQHRGEEGAGIVSYDSKDVKYVRNVGLTDNVFNEKNLSALGGHVAIGHNNCLITGEHDLRNIQPILIELKGKPIAIAYDGAIINAQKIKQDLEDDGVIFQTSADLEVMLHLIAREKTDGYQEKIASVLSKVRGAYSLVMLYGDNLIAARDPYGFKPLCLGKIDGGYVISSETCAFDLISAEYIRDIEPGEVLFINENGLESIKFAESQRHAFCIFEFIYFARPDSNVFTKNVYLTRKNLGKKLAEEAPAAVDFVIPLPDSGVYAALGFAERSGLPFEVGVIRNHYIGRTFIRPIQALRDFMARIKLNPVKDLLYGKKVVVVEDSIVRGTTCRNRIKTLRDSGVKEIHMRISCPPLKFPCFYGMNFPTKDELIASKMTIDEVKNFLGVDSLYHLSKESMLESMLLGKNEFCTTCFDGVYPL